MGNGLCVCVKQTKMHALVNVFLRCLSFLLPPSWLSVSSCLWVGNACEKTNPDARFKSRKPLTYEEVKAAEAVAAVAVEAHGGSSPPPSLILGQGCVSPAATSPTVPQSPTSGRIWIRGLWRAVERVFRGPWIFLRHRWCQKKHRAPYPVRSIDSDKTLGFQGDTAVTRRRAKEITESTLSYSENMSGSVGIHKMKTSKCISDGVDEVITVDKLSQEMGTVTITVAIQAAEDEEPEELSSSNIDILGGSCSEDEMGRHDKSSGAGTSGGELEEESWQPPDPELINKLVSQIEYYLSDENLEHDAFLLKHVRRNKLGFVSVKLLTSFKKVKHLTRDWRTTAYALRHSNILELNDEGRKVRRKSAVPVFASESLPSRMLLLSDLQRWPELAALTKENGGSEGGA
ncbi:hypothetical protein NL108_004532, partial [Boleophthalmus pectinirostris]